MSEIDLLFFPLEIFLWDFDVKIMLAFTWDDVSSFSVARVDRVFFEESDGKYLGLCWSPYGLCCMFSLPFNYLCSHLKMNNWFFLAGLISCVGSCVILLKSLYKIDIISFLNIWKNSLENYSGSFPCRKM